VRIQSSAYWYNMDFGPQIADFCSSDIVILSDIVVYRGMIWSICNGILKMLNGETMQMGIIPFTSLQPVHQCTGSQYKL
jgi:hypothetical protein